MLAMQNGRNRGVASSLPGCANPASKTSRKAVRGAWGLLLTLVTGGIVVSCSASEIIAPADGFKQESLRPLMSAIVTHFPKQEIQPEPPHTNPCPPFQPVVLEGRTIVSFHSTFVPTTGNLHFYSELHTTGTATSVTSEAELTPDDVWKVDSRKMSEKEIAGPLPVEWTEETHDRFVGQGKNPNFMRHIVIHMTVNANGVPTANVAKTQYHCEDVTS